MRWSIVLSLLLVPSLAHASSVADDERLRTERVWYGWQPLVVDLVAISGAVATTNITTNDDALLVPVGAYVLGPSVVHAAHGNWIGAVGSVGLRISLPWLLASAGSQGCGGHATTDANEDCAMGGAFKGALVGVVIASAFDALAFSWSDRPRTAAPTPNVAPTASVSPTGATFGLTGVF